jgi:hypothetical protein
MIFRDGMVASQVVILRSSYGEASYRYVGDKETPFLCWEVL